jgi:hypothetical protein
MLPVFVAWQYVPIIGIHIPFADIPPVCRLRLRGRVSKEAARNGARADHLGAGYHAFEFVQENYTDWMRDPGLLGDDEPHRTSHSSLHCHNLTLE